MNNREKINAMTNEDLAKLFCNEIMGELDRECDFDTCKICPFTKLCSYGHPGFLAWLEQEAEENSNAQKV